MIGQCTHILVPTDFRPAAREAYSVALATAMAAQARVTLLHVTPNPTPVAPHGLDAIAKLRETLWSPDGDSLVVSTFFDKDAARREAELRLDREIHPEWRGPVDVRLEWRWGDVLTEVISYCRDEAVDLVVMPVRRRRPWLSLRPDLARQLARQTHCPVILVHPAETVRGRTRGG